MEPKLSDIESIGQAGVEAMERGDGETARRLFAQLIASGHSTAPAWVMLAQACRATGDSRAERDAIDRALALDPRNLRGVIMKGDSYARSGDDRAASAWYHQALRLAPAAGTLPPGLQSELRRVSALTQLFSQRYRDQLERHLTEAGLDESSLSRRVQEALDILSEKKKVYLQEPTSFFFPGLPQIQFYERSDFPWIEAVEAATPRMRAELEAVLGDGEAFRPYVQAPSDRPFNDAHALLNNSAWTAFYLWENGQLVDANAARCPITIEVLSHCPMPRIRTRSPMALFSLLRPGTHIAPHNGMLNTRLICHIPLIVPPNCRLRVGNEIREVEQGKALIFDDSIEHEAWNDSDQTRVVLLFEIWRPELAADERDALTVIFEAINDYGGEAK